MFWRLRKSIVDEHSTKQLGHTCRTATGLGMKKSPSPTSFPNCLSKKKVKFSLMKETPSQAGIKLISQRQNSDKKKNYR